ncbi:hypothetical protein EEDFHM_02073 [Methylorubrum populi]
MDQSADPSSWSDAPIYYEERIVAYFDVLGWKNVIEDAGVNPTRLGQLRSLVGLYGYLQKQIVEDSRGSAISAFSDNVVASQRYDADALQDFIDTIGRYQFAAALNGFFIRGAVTVGDLFHDRTSVFGPALIRAHDLESREAKYPRVILDPGRMDVLGSSKRIRTLDGHFTIDTFGAEFIRVCAAPTLQAASSSLETPPTSNRMVLIPAATLRLILTNVEASLARTDVDGAREKLVWLKANIEDSLREMT